MHPVASLQARRNGGRVGALVLALALAGCTSPAERFQKGRELEQGGDLVRAADQYIAALRQDRDLVDARTRLTAIAPALAEHYLERARAYGEAGNFVGASDTLRDLDEFARDASGVGVPVTTPEDYADQRRETFDLAIEQLMHQGEEAEAVQHWEDAVERYRHIETLAPSSEQREAGTMAAARAATSWGHADLAEGQFRQAYEHAELAVSLAGGAGRPAAAEAEALRSEVLARGTIKVGFAPIGGSEHGLLSSEIVGALNDAFEVHNMEKSEVFITAINSAHVRQELRHAGLLGKEMGATQASRIARLLDADVLVTAWVEAYDVMDVDVERLRKQTMTKKGSRVTYIERSGKRQHRIRLTYAVVEEQRMWSHTESSVEADESCHFFELEYDGKQDELLLDSVTQMRMKKPKDCDAQQRVIATAAEQLAARVYQDLNGLVP